MEEMDYRSAYLQIAADVSRRFPECEVCTVDMVRLLIYENDTLRLALSIPHPSRVLAAEEENDD